MDYNSIIALPTPQARQKMKLIKNHIEVLKDAIFEISPISNDSWEAIKSLAYLMKIDKGEYFSREGEKAKGLGIILKGICRIYYLDDNGNEWNKHFLQKNDFIASSISPEKFSITNIQALTDTEIIFLSLPKLLELSKKHNDLLVFLQKLTFSYLEQKQEREINLLSKTALDNYITFKKDFPTLENEIQHFHIASYLGITPTQLSRVRKKLPHQQM